MTEINLDPTPEAADWIKQSWDLPPYKSKEFFQQVSDLDAFRKSPLYAMAEAQGLIHDDEWVADWVTDATDTPRRQRAVIIHKD